ncbi:hypothetical protein SAMN05660380_00591 [Xylella fastidiosa]|jgi:hypothetical protein|nr:hypothetical protein SAMN05660380_00591 [Xylella fastidiosa]
MVEMSAAWVCCVIAYSVVMRCLMFLWLAKQEMSIDVPKLSCQCIEQPIIVSVGHLKLCLDLFFGMPGS